MDVRYRRDLWQLLVDLSCGDAAEIGVAEGRFSAEILAWPVKFPRLYMVDRWSCVPEQTGDASFPQPWHDSNKIEAFRRVTSHGERAILLQGDSVEMADRVPDESLILVYIDGDHSFDGVTRDIEAWLPKLVHGGCMAFHDYESADYGVRRAVDRFCTDYRLDLHHIPEDKAEDAGAWFWRP